MSSLVIRQGRLLDPTSNLDRVADLLVHDGRIERIDTNLRAPDDAQQIDAAGRWVAPGFIELSCQSGEPGREDRETFATMLEAAARGGFTQVALEPNTTPVNDEASLTARLLALADTERARHHNQARPRVLPMAALSKSLKAEEQTDAGELRATGAVALSDGGALGDYSFLRRALEYAVSHELPVHLNLCSDARVHEGEYASRLGLKAQHRHEESARAQEACTLAAMTGARVHLSALSTPEAVDALTTARGRTSGAIAVDNLFDDHALLANYEPTSKLRPPLRSKSDCEALRNALAGTSPLSLSARHRPRTYTELRTTFNETSGGRSTLEYAVARSMSLVHDFDLPPLRWVALWTLGPARALGVAAPTLQEGASAQITIIDPSQRWQLDPNAMTSRGRNVPPSLGSLVGRVTHTLVDGSVAFELC